LWRHRSNAEVFPEADEKKPFPKLGYAVPDGIQLGIADPVALLGQFRHNGQSEIHAPYRQHAGNILNDNGFWSPQTHCLEKALVELIPGIPLKAVVTQAVELPPSEAGKPLTGWSSNEDVWGGIRDGGEIQYLEIESLASKDARWRVGLKDLKITVEGLAGNRINIDSGCENASRSLEPQGKSSSSAEQIDHT
jgi:hypothetical protein